MELSEGGEEVAGLLATRLPLDHGVGHGRQWAVGLLEVELHLAEEQAPVEQGEEVAHKEGERTVEVGGGRWSFFRVRI